MKSSHVNKGLIGSALGLSALWALAVQQDVIDSKHNPVPLGILTSALIATRVRSHKMTARHEAGHALMCYLTKGAGAVHNVTAFPGFSRNKDGTIRSYSGLMRYNKDRLEIPTIRELDKHLKIAFAGKVAEALYYGSDHQPDGIGPDMAHAKEYASMIAELELLPQYNDFHELMENHGPTGVDTSARVEELMQHAEHETHRMLSAHKYTLDQLSRALMVHYRLSGHSNDKICGKPHSAAPQAGPVSAL